MAIAIIAEYNPFHNGHIYQLEYVKKNFPNDKIFVILSGKYVQRGEMAVASFEQRKKIALEYGADYVVELPFEYATQAAHIFASGALKIINDLKIDKIIFGSESNDVNNLIKIAETIYFNEQVYNKLLKANLKNGFSFPNASSKALSELTGEKIIYPNDILGLEYVKAIVFNNYKITPFTLKRTVAYHSQETNNQFASASLIRKMIFANQDVSEYTPMKFNFLPDRIENYYAKFQKIVRETPASELSKNPMISEGMENLFKKNIDAKSYEEFVEICTSRRYTSSRIKRVMLYVLLEKHKEK
ncbi:nucleotidyltransferase [Mesomycoplasma lagogenitalium]|uniref:tRNA(Met) cytidine acetate ligase n=1 Tax=Mesomycoplasma lagogenitalium TaxID=171286 RepID=A0ABY8LUM9_9BACT|nr:nucleotidyltransferase [Mesomycoplasma lagogenitalium]WGI36955.1 nucleotidyltransferase [Mesomycoplasma lagogenitalium]